MMTALKYTAIASAFLLTAGSAAFAQNYSGNSNEGGYGYSQGYNQGSQGQGYGNEGGQQGYNQNQGWGGQQGYNQGWNRGNEGSSSWGSSNSMNEQRAVQELRNYGYNNLNDIRPMRGWSAEAERNGQRVHIIMGDNGEVATFRGAPNGGSGSE